MKWRVFFERIRDGLYVASKQYILEDLPANKDRPGPGGPKAHAMVRIRPSIGTPCCRASDWAGQKAAGRRA